MMRSGSVYIRSGSTVCHFQQVRCRSTLANLNLVNPNLAIIQTEQLVLCSLQTNGRCARKGRMLIIRLVTPKV
jgi:uncharacterized protein YceH (UPF0502 family)